MKKLVYSLLGICALLCASCEKADIGGTATQALSGQWYVTVDAVVGEDIYEDCWSMGSVLILTYNNNANDANKFYVNDLDNIWDFKVQVPCSVDNLSFGLASAKDSVMNEAYEVNVALWGGKIMKGAGKQKNGSAADSIVFNVNFGDDTDADYYRIRGIRYSGLVEND